MRLTDLLVDDEARAALASRIAGVVVAVVTNTHDPEGLARVKVRFPWLSDQAESPWARVACLMAGGGRGAYFLPEVDDEVLVAFEQGDMRLPYVIGALWNGKDLPPSGNEGGKNDVRMIRSRSGHVVRFIDKQGGEKIEIEDHAGKNRIVIDAAGITLSAVDGTITLEANELVLKSSGQGTLHADGILEVSGKTVNIN